MFALRKHSFIRIDGIDLIESTVLEFIHCANNLKEIHIHSSSYLKLTEMFMLKIVEELKSSRSQNATQPFIDFYEKILNFQFYVNV